MRRDPRMIATGGATGSRGAVPFFESAMLIDMNCGQTPKRGDIIQTNVGDRRERTWLVLHARRVRRRDDRTKYVQVTPRFDVWAARWWELEPDFRMRLFHSAERRGGQQIIYFRRYPAKKKRRPVWI